MKIRRRCRRSGLLGRDGYVFVLISSPLLSTVDTDLYLQLLYANIELAILTITFARLSVLCLYYRLFSTTSRLLNILLYVLGLMSIAWMTSLLIATMLQCKPLGSYLDPTVKRT